MDLQLLQNNLPYIHRFRTLFALLLIPFAQYSQKVDVSACQKLFPEYSYIYLENSSNTEIKVIKNNILITAHYHEKLLLLNGKLNAIHSKKIRTTEFVTVKNLKANLLISKNGTHNKTKITDITLKSENSGESAFYDGDQFYTVNFLSAKEGDIVTIDYDLEYSEPRFFGKFFFSDYSPVIKVEHGLSYPKNLITLIVKEINNQQLKIRSVKDSTENTINQKWTIDTVAPITDEFLDQGFKYKASYILLNITKYKTKDSLINLCGTLPNLYEWYNTLLKKVDLSPDKPLSKLTDSLIIDKTNDIEKIKAIFYWVQTKIAYLAYEEGLGGYVPRESAVVCKRRFGDCKDMANLLVRMGKLAGLPVYHTWIGTKDIPFQFSEFPAPFCANHMIATYIQNGDTLFLDATGKDHPFAFPTSMIQGKEAFVGIDSTHFLITKVPFVKNNLTIEHDSLILNILPNNIIKGAGYYTVTGFEKIRLLNYLSDKSYHYQKEYLKSSLQKANNKFMLDTFYLGENDYEKPLVLYYTFLIKDHLIKDGNINFVNLNFMGNYFDKISFLKRKYPFDFPFSEISRLTVTVNLNKGDKIEHIPDNIKLANEVLSFDLSYDKHEKYLTFKNTICIHKTLIGLEDFKDLEMIVNAYKKNKSNLISLRIN